MNPWLKGLLAGLISGTAQGVLIGFAAKGIAPGAFDFAHHSSSFFAIAGTAAFIGAVTGVCAYLAKSPLP